jgi:hypothetical protein
MDTSVFWLEKRLSRSALGLGFALVLAANAGCSGDGDQLPALQPAETPDAGHPEAPQHDAGSQADAATPDVIPPSPTASAGTDQTALAGATVTLSGQGQDETGAALGYRWTQIAGPTITLAAPDRAQTTFTAPLVSGELEFQLAVQSENGQGSDRIKISVSAPPALFVTNRTEASVSRFAISPELDGNVAPEATWRGNDTRLSPPSALIVDKADGLVVATVATGERTSLLGFSSAFGSGGNAFPERYFPWSSFGYGSLDAMAYDRANDLLFLFINSAIPTLFVYADVATRAFTSGAKPKATLGFGASAYVINGWKIRDLELSASGELYLVHSAFEHVVYVFSKASAINNGAGPSRILTMGIRDTTDAFIDTSDRLYVVSSHAPEVLVFENASSLKDAITPTRKINVTIEPLATGFNGITVDAAGTAYVTASNADAFYVIESIASKSGAVTPDRTITGTATGLSGPGKLTAVAR